MGIFLSSWDTWLHSHFFPEAWQVALVIEPYSKSGGFFIQQPDGALDGDSREEPLTFGMGRVDLAHHVHPFHHLPEDRVVFRHPRVVLKHDEELAGVGIGSPVRHGDRAAQAHHFLGYSVEKIPYAMNRYKNEANRLYGVLDRRLGEARYLAGEYSIADIATYPWVARHDFHKTDLAQYPNVKRWLGNMKKLKSWPSVNEVFYGLVESVKGQSFVRV